jgi:hypothetical protein
MAEDNRTEPQDSDAESSIYNNLIAISGYINQILFVCLFCTFAIVSMLSML